MAGKANNPLEGVPTATPPMGKGAGATSRSAMTAAVITWMANAPESELVDFFEKSLIPPAPVGNAAGSNMASIAMKGKATDTTGGVVVKEAFEVIVKDDLKNIFEGDLTEEAKEEVTTLFEAAVNSQVDLLRIELTEEHDRVLLEETEKLRETLVEDVNNYLTFAADKWLEENKLQVTQALKIEQTNKFMEGLKKLFAESYVEVPEEKVDVVAGLEEQVAELTTQMDESIAAQIALSKEVEAFKRKEVLAEMITDLSVSQVERFKSLVANINEEDVDAYRRKLGMIKNGYFKPATINEQLDVVGITSLEEETAVNTPKPQTLVEATMGVLSKSARS